MVNLIRKTALFSVLSHKGLPEGKLPIDVLKPMLDSIPKGSLVVPPSIGVDIGVTRSKGKYIVSSSDPITGAEKRLGWHAVNVSANDVATSGIMPDNLNVVGLFPRNTPVEKIRSLMNEINRTALQLGITVAGGHTEVTPGLMKPIVVVTSFGSGNRFITSAQAKAGDTIIMSKTAGIEGTSILAGLPAMRTRLSSGDYNKGRGLIEKLSVIPEARLAFRTGGIHAMHDVTEGGVLGAVTEMALASGLGFELDESSVPVDTSTMKICQILSINPLRLIGSGSLLISCLPKEEDRVKKVLMREGISASCIGRFLLDVNKRFLSSEKGGRSERIRLLSLSVQDELWPALSRFGR